MRIFQLIAIAFFSLALSTNQSRAQQPDILGTWSAKADIMLELNEKVVKVPRTLSVVIDKVEGRYFTGRRTWQALTNDPGFVGDANVLGATEPFIGAIDTDGVTLRFVETDDRGMMFAELLGPNELEFTYMETHPHAVIYTVILRRKTGK